MKGLPNLGIILILALSACALEPRPKAIESRSIAQALSPYVKVNARRIAIIDVTLITGDGGPALSSQDIVIADGLIESTGPTGTLEITEDTLIIKASGHSLIPGIIGMHNHTHIPGTALMDYTAPRLYLASGVTTIATAGSADAAKEIRLAKSIMDGEIPGPFIVPSAPYVTGPGGNGPMTKPNSTKAAKVFVDTWSERGAKWIKLYRHTDPDIARTIIDQAHRRGLKVTGHLCSITYGEAAAMGIDSLEHGLNPATDFAKDKPYGKCVGSRASKVVLSPDSPEIAALIATLIDHDVTLTSTLAILESGFPHRPQGEARALKVLTPENRETYKERQARLKAGAANTTSTPKYWDLLLSFEKQFVDAGGHLVAGPDTGRHILPGFGDQRNLELLTEAGFSVEAAVRIMTFNGAKTLGIDDIKGLIKPGYAADLVLVKGDLTKAVSSIRNTQTVFRDGIGYDPVSLIKDVEGQVGRR